MCAIIFNVITFSVTKIYFIQIRKSVNNKIELNWIEYYQGFIFVCLLRGIQLYVQSFCGYHILQCIAMY